MTDDIKRAVRTFIVESFLFGEEGSLPADGDSLIEGGVIDSTGVLELVAFLEDRFGFAMADADIVPANLDSIEAIAGFARRKSAAPLAA